MIPMMVHRYHIANRLAGNELLRFREHRKCSRLTVRRVDDDDVITHRDGEAVMRAARQPEDAVGDLLRLDAARAGCSVELVASTGGVTAVFEFTYTASTVTSSDGKPSSF